MVGKPAGGQGLRETFTTIVFALQIGLRNAVKSQFGNVGMDVVL